MGVLVEVVGVNVDDTCGHWSRTALASAAHTGQVCAIKYLVEQGADVSRCDNCHFSPLLLACDRGHVNVVQHLAEECDVPIDKEDKLFGSALMYATQLGHMGVVQYLIGRGASVSLTSTLFESREYNALTVAETNRRNHIVQFLTEHMEKNP